MHGTLQPLMRSPGPRADAGARLDDRLLWMALVPLILLLRPYEGLIQDARIYLGSALADRDPLGIGQDLMFAADGQTGFTLLKPLLRALLGVMAPVQVSMVLALIGSLVWLAAVVVLCRRLAPGRLGWAAAICILALPPDYGAYGTFVYGETVVTPRVFAEAATIGAMAAYLGGRRWVSLLLLGIAVAMHPLIGLPGVAVAAVVLAWEDRRWLLPMAAMAVAVVAAAALKLPVAGRLFEPMDPDWLGILKVRSVNLFPSLWTGDVFAHVAARAAAVVVAASMVQPRLRRLLWAALGVGIGGLVLTALLGDWYPLVLVTQLQLWRALWLLALLGNASVALAAVGLWRRGGTAHLTLAVLAVAWLMPSATLTITLSAAAVLLHIADARGALSGVRPRIAQIAIITALVLIAIDTIVSGIGMVMYLQAAREQGGEPLFDQMLVPGLQRWPLVLGCVALALRQAGENADRPPARVRSKLGRTASVLGLVAACLVGALLWNTGGSERRLIDSVADAGSLKLLIGNRPGSVLWVDDYNQSWFLADRPAYFNSTQGCPILFSRGLALAWWKRGQELVSEGLARRVDLKPWTTQSQDEDKGAMTVSRASVEAVCRAPDHPVAIVAPGTHLDAAPPGWPAGLWHPPATVQYLSGDDSGLRWHRVENYTVIQCHPADTEAAASPS